MNIPPGIHRIGPVSPRSHAIQRVSCSVSSLLDNHSSLSSRSLSFPAPSSRHTSASPYTPYSDVVRRAQLPVQSHVVEASSSLLTPGRVEIASVVRTQIFQLPARPRAGKPPSDCEVLSPQHRQTCTYLASWSLPVGSCDLSARTFSRSDKWQQLPLVLAKISLTLGLV